MAFYLLMGWLILVAMYPLIQALPRAALVLLVLGGILYTSGITFYILDERMKHAYGICIYSYWQGAFHTTWQCCFMFSRH